MVFGCLVCACHAEQNYMRTGIVSNIQNGVVMIEDTTGNTWKWNTEKGEDFKIGEKVALKMNANGSVEDFEDDIIKKVYKK